MVISAKKNNKKINFAVVGLGMTSRYFIKAIKNNPQANLISVCDVDENKRFQKIFKGVIFYNDLKNILSDERVDTVVVATPNYTHFKIIKECLRFNKNVICEKPLGVDYDQTKKLISTAYKKKLLLVTAFHRRYNKHLAELRSNNINNNIKIINARYFENIDQHTNCHNWLSDAKRNGGGCVIDNGINVIDTVRNLVGELKLKRVFMGYAGKPAYCCEVNAYLEFTFKKNGIFNLELDWKYNGETKDLTVYYSNGKLKHLDFLKGFKGFKSSLTHEYCGIIKDFIDKLNRKKISKDINSLKASKLIDEIYEKSARV